MTKAVIIEDEKNESDYLLSMLKEIESDISVMAVLQTVEESINYFTGNGKVDIIFSDVQLRDGLSFSIFSSLPISVPIIFITGYDRFMLDAFENNGIDYLLKPISREDLEKAIKKYRSFENHFTGNNAAKAADSLLNYINVRKKLRIVVRKGVENISMLLSDVAFFFTENKVVYAIDRNGKKFLVDKNLSDLEQELDSKAFFRANRQYMINIDFIKCYKAYERVKLWVELTLNDPNHSIIISQETAPLFRKWLLEA
jgi:DNA-binding LytR/AlgR family response regulator